MCTAIRMKGVDAYFGRNLDLNAQFGQKVVLTPRNYRFSFTGGESSPSHYAILGIATVIDGYPLYADALNERGLAIAGLNYPGNAKYSKTEEGKVNVSPFELIPYILSRFASVKEARGFLERLNLVDIPFSKDVPLASLHWMLSDESESVVIESDEGGLHVYDNPYDVLTNNPPFPFHRENMKHYRLLSNKQGEAGFSKDIDLTPFSVGFGSMFLPGDYSSSSRFVKACFLAKHVLLGESEAKRRRTFFRLLSSLSFPLGTVLNPDSTYERTIYSSCMNLSKKTYAYISENGEAPYLVRMVDFDLEGNSLLVGPLMEKEAAKTQSLSPITK